jgi:hypothetical protein
MPSPTASPRLNNNGDGAVWRILPQNKMVHKWRLISILLEIKKKKSKKYIQRGRVLNENILEIN